MAKKQYTRWVIVGECGLYVGQCLTRKDAIGEHLEAKFGTVRDNYGLGLSTEQLRRWNECKALGDRAVKATITVVQWHQEG